MLAIPHVMMMMAAVAKMMAFRRDFSEIRHMLETDGVSDSIWFKDTSGRASIASDEFD